ncbi:MAG: DUF1641 domain-containing protein [Halobacteria archaeon]|nr:DUF1641 domain-containing protein [Halobacteria archaeon]
MDELENLISRNPDAVAERLEEMGVADEVLEGVDVEGEDEKTTRTVESTIDANRNEINEAVLKVVELERDGTLDELVGLANALTLVSSALDDEMVMSVAGTASSLGEVADAASDEDAVRAIEDTVNAVSEARRDSEPVGVLGMLGAMRKPEVRRSLGFMISMAKNLGERLERDKRDKE